MNDLPYEAGQNEPDRYTSLGRLMPGIAHDFNNLVAVIGLYAQLGLRDESLNPELKEALEVILGQASRVKRLTDKLTEYSRIAAANLQPVGLAGVIAGHVQSLQEMTPQNIHVEYHQGPGHYSVLADPAGLYKLLHFLSMNAMDLMPGGGILTISVSDRMMEEAVKCNCCHTDINGSWVCLEVKDTGKGINLKGLDNLFDPQAVYLETGVSTAIGLSLAADIARQHQGHIIVASELDKGTEVKVFLPHKAASLKGTES